MTHELGENEQMNGMVESLTILIGKWMYLNQKKYYEIFNKPRTIVSIYPDV